MTPKRPVVLITGPESLPGFERSVRRLHRRCARWTPMEFQPVPLARLRGRLARFGRQPTTIVITSSEGIQAFLRPFFAEFRRCEIVVAGPSTRRRLEALGCPRVKEGHPLGESGVVRILARGPRRTIIYARSDRAGPDLGRRLRGQGHNVLDLIAYRIVARPVRGRALTHLTRPFTAVITSPSALSELRRGWSTAQFAQFRRMARPLTLGPKTARAVRGHGLSNVRLAGFGHGRSSGRRTIAHSLLAAIDAEP